MMNHSPKSIRPFIGAENYELSRSFYRDLGFVPEGEMYLEDNIPHMTMRLVLK